MPKRIRFMYWVVGLVSALLTAAHVAARITAA